MKEKLCKLAVDAAKNSYSPYSGFKVGAALLCENGEIFTGTNIENSSYSATICAERVAIFSAVNGGNRTFSAIAIAGGRDKVGIEKCFPCGACRQVMAEFCNKDFKIWLVSEEGIGEYTLSDLLPNSFSL